MSASPKPSRSEHSCAVCSRPLVVPESVEIGIGPVCRADIAARADAEDAKTCRRVGCLESNDHIPTIVGRARQWIANMAEGAGEPLPDQTKMLLLLRRMNEDRIVFTSLNPACPLRHPDIQHHKAPDVLSTGAWIVATWLRHHVEPWLWHRHRNLLEEVARMYQHSSNLLELCGVAHEAEEVRKMGQEKRSGTQYRKKIYRRAQWRPTSKELV